MEDVRQVYTDSEVEEEKEDLGLSAGPDAGKMKTVLYVRTASTDEVEHFGYDVSVDAEADKMVDVKNSWGENEEQGFSQLHFAAKRGDMQAVRSLLMSSANVDVLDTKNNTPLHIAARYGRVDVVNHLISEKADVNSRIASGQTSLHLAAKRGDKKTVRSLLMSSAKIDAQDTENDTPLHIATRNHHLDVVNLLLRKSANVNSQNSIGQTAFHTAFEKGYYKIAQLLLNSNADVDIIDKYINTPIGIATMRHRERDLRLLKNQAQSKLSGRNDRQLHLAAKCGHIETVQLLLNSNENPNARNSHGDTALHLASDSGHSEVVEVLLKNGADVNISNAISETPLHIAAELGYTEIVKAMIDYGGNINALNYAKTTPLHLACQNGHTSIAELLLDNHAIVDAVKQSEEAPLYLAVRNGHADIVDLLLRRGACDFVVDVSSYETPLHVAVEKGHTKVVEVILKHSRRIYVELARDGNKLQENVMKFELSESYGRRYVSAGVILTEKHVSLELLRNSDGYTALDLAVRLIKPKMVQLFLNGDHNEYSEDHLRASFDHVIKSIIEFDKDYKINYEKSKQIAQALLNSNKFNVNHQNERGATSLHCLMDFMGSLDNLSAKNINTATFIANDMIQSLLENGADCNMKTSTGETPLMIASERGCCDAIKILFDWEKTSGAILDLDARDQNGETALIRAAERHHVSVVQLLLNHNASVNLHSYYEFTALHAAFLDEHYEKWLDLHYFCKGLLKRNVSPVDSPELGWPKWENETLYPNKVIGRLQKYLERSNEITRLKEEVVKLLSGVDKLNVNAKDFMGNTPLDLAVASSKRITSATIEALKSRSAIEKFLEPADESSIEVARIDERGRNPLHRLIISCFSDYVDKNRKDDAEADTFRERFNLMVPGILLRPEKFSHLATATDDKGRIPLHYAATCISPSFDYFFGDELIDLLLKLGSNVNASDMYGKTPLHYADKMSHDSLSQYDHLVQCGADENKQNTHGHTPKKLRQLRETVMVNENNERGLPIEKIYRTRDVAQLFNTKHVIKLTKHRLVETISIDSKSSGSQRSSEEAIWKIWTKNDLFRLNRRLSHLKPSVQHFIERLASGMKEKDGRFECQPNLVGSADEETKVAISADFDFNFKLIKFSQLCEAFPHPLGPKGYFQLRQKSNEDAKSRTDEEFDSFFNLDQCLLTNEVNSRFKIILDEVLSDPTLWKGEHQFDWNVRDAYERRCRSQSGLCKTLLLKMINPVVDGEGGFLFVDISIDIVACVEVTDWWPDDPLPVGISPVVKEKRSTFVFDRQRFDPTKPDSGVCQFSETFARISFAPLESRIVNKRSPLMKAAYIFCKWMLYSQRKTTYQLKNCLLFCMEALNSPSESETRNDNEITPKKLAFWVERIMFCLVEFSRNRIYPCYFMPSFRQKVFVRDDYDYVNLELCGNDLTYKTIFSAYIDLVLATIDIPIVRMESCLDLLEPTDSQMCKEFDREELIRKLSSRSIPTD